MERNDILAQLALTAIKAAVSAGERIMEIYSCPQSQWEVESKADNSPLTIADKESNRIITEYLENNGRYPILSEEGAHLPYSERKCWESLWVIDPLDGTKEFLKRNDEFTVNIALVEKSHPTIGIIYVPATRMLYFGIVGEGAWAVADFLDTEEELSLDGLKAAALQLPSERPDGKTFVVAASRSHLNAETENFVSKLKEKHGNVVFKQAGSSLKICLVAEGAADVYPRLAPTMEWDTAAGHAILKAAGGEIFQYNSREPLAYNKEDLHNPSFLAVPDIGNTNY